MRPTPATSCASRRLTDAGLFEDDPDLKIRVPSTAARTITVSDNGIGMSRQEVIDNIGTIAKSGTREFFGRLTGDQAEGRAADRPVRRRLLFRLHRRRQGHVESRRAGLRQDEGVRWESGGEGDYTIEIIEQAGARHRSDLASARRRGRIAVEGLRLQSIIRKYSDHISLPILMNKQEWDKDKGEHVTRDELEKVNQASALWARPKSEITEQQYREFYKHVSHDFEEPLAWVHAKVEGKSEYTQLLYIPARAPFDLWDREHRHGIKLYVRRVFIMDDAEQLLPAYLRFVRGVVDSNDLPLNVSREILQESKDVEPIRKGCVNKVLGLLEDLAQTQSEKYATCWKEFGRVLKEGVGEDWSNKERIAKLLRFASTHADSEEQSVSLSDYVARMKDGQAKIYHITADSFAAAKNSPHLEIFRKKGIEVLLLSDRVDEWVGSNLTEFEGKPMASVAKGDLDLGKLADEDKKEQEKEAGENKELVENIGKSLGDRVKDVRVTLRLTSSPACLVADQHGMSGNLERMLKAAGQTVPGSKPVLEINPHHPLVQLLKYETDKGRFGDWSHILFDQALLAEGGQLDDPASFVKRLNEMMLTLANK